MTIKDIARESGYAVSTVSRALNNHPDVSEDAKRCIQAIVERHSFVPNSNAQQLKQQAPAGVAVLVKGTHNMLFASILERLQSAISAAGYTASVYYCDEEENEVNFAARICREKKPLGMLFLGGNLSYFEQGFAPVHPPCVLLTTAGGMLPFDNLSSVSTDDVQAGSAAIRHLAEQGHRTIGIIGGRLESSVTSRLRYEGCMRSLAEHGLVFQPEAQFQTARFSYGSGYRAMERLIKSCPELTAVFAMSDVMAIGAIRSLHDLGRSVPGDISVIGFDGVELADYCNPRLTTIRQSQGLLAERGVTLLLERIRNGGHAVHEIVPFELSPGESVRRLGDPV